MSTPAQTEANRRNAAKSTGPRTTEGKATVARNAVTHGFYCQHLILPGENEAELQALRQSLYQRLRPVDDLEKLYVERMAIAAWKIQRSLGAERKLMKRIVDVNMHEAMIIHAADLDRFHRQLLTLERAMDRALSQLQKLQKLREERGDEPGAELAPENRENKPNSVGTPIAGPPASAGGPPVTSDPSASMKIEIVETNPISREPGTPPTEEEMIADIEAIEAIESLGTNPKRRRFELPNQ